MSKTDLIAITAYFPNDPKGLFEFLQKHMDGPNKKVPIYLWVDNDDHRTSSEFYTLRKMMRSGLDIKVYINPPLETQRKVYDYLETQVRKA